MTSSRRPSRRPSRRRRSSIKIQKSNKSNKSNKRRSLATRKIRKSKNKKSVKKSIKPKKSVKKSVKKSAKKTSRRIKKTKNQIQKSSHKSSRVKSSIANYSKKIEIFGQEMTNVFNLKPGQGTPFLTYMIYFIDLRTTAWPTKDPEYPRATFYDGTIEACRGGIQKSYIKHEIKKSHYAVVAIHHDEKLNRSEINGFLLAHPDKQDPKDGLYVSLYCAKKSEIRIRVAHLLKLSMLHYGVKHLGIKHYYNSAADLNLVPFYAQKVGMTLRATNCNAKDDIARQFNEINKTNAEKQEDFTEALVTTRGSGYKLDSTESYPMKLCNLNITHMFKSFYEESMNVFKGLKHTLETLV